MQTKTHLNFFVNKFEKFLRIQQGFRLLIKEGLVRRSAALGDEKKVVLVAGRGVELDLGRQVGSGVFFQIHVDWRNLEEKRRS